MSYTTYFNIGRPHPTPTRIKNPTRSTDILATTKKSVELRSGQLYNKITKFDNVKSILAFLPYEKWETVTDFHRYGVKYIKP